MKKLSFFLMAMLVSLASLAAEQTATISFADKAQRTVFTAEQQVWEQNGLVVTNDKAASTNDVADYANPARFYKGSALTIKCTLGNIAKIVVNCDDYKATYPADLVTSVGAEAVADGTVVTITPTIESDTYSIATLAAQVRVDDMVVTYVAAEQGATVPTNAELWEAFKPYYNTYYGLSRADQTIENAATFAATYMQKIMTDPESEYKWLGDYIQTVATAAGKPLSTDMAAANESGWRWSVWAFLNACEGKNGSAGIDFTEAGKPENWGPYYLAAQNPEPVYETMELTMTNLEVSAMGGATGLWASDNETGIEVMLFLDAEGNLMAESSIMVSWMDYNVTGTVTKAYNEELATDVYTAELYTTVGESNYKLVITMYSVPVVPTVVIVKDATIDDQTEATGFMFMNGTWESEGVVYPVKAEVPGFDATVAEAVYNNVTVTVGGMGDTDPWLGFVQGEATITIADNVVTLTGLMSSWDGLNLDLTIVAVLPVEEPVKPEPNYTENKLNPYAFGLESELTEEALVVTYRLNNSNATSVDVVVYNGEDAVAIVPGTTTIGKNTVNVPTTNFPSGVELTWSVIVKGTSVEAPTKEDKIYSFYHPSGVDIDVNPENETFGLLLVNEGMQKVKDVTGYVSTGFGAGIFAFTPSFDLIPNGEVPGFNGGIEFTNGRADAPGSTAYAPRRIRISEDGRIFVTSLNTDGNYLWEVNPANLNEWNPVFKGASLNAQAELLTADSAFIAAPNNGFDVKGSGENLQLAMYSVNLSGITAAAMGGFRLHEYNLGTETQWTTAPTKTLVEGKYAINYTGTQVEYDNEGGFWICSYRGSATEANPGLVHINAEGVEDVKLVWNNLKQAGIRFNNDFTKLIVADNSKKAIIYTISKDDNGAPVLTKETDVDMTAVGNNLNDFAWDYAGNLYSCGNSSEKLAAWAMPYSGEVETPAASKYAFSIGELRQPVEMVGTVKRALQNGGDVVVLTHEADGTAHIYNVVDGLAYELSQEGVIAVDAENAGDLLAISDIAMTEDGKLVAINKMVCQAGDAQVDEGYKRGETRVYIWNDLNGAPTLWFTSKMSSNWYRSVQGNTMAYKGTSTNGTLFTTGVTATGVKFRYSVYNVIDGVYTEPAVNDSEHYHFTKGDAQTTDLLGDYELVASPLATVNWILDGTLVDPFEIVDPMTYNTQVAVAGNLAIDLGKKYNGSSIVTVGEQVLMVAPYANAEGKLAGVKVLDIATGLATATEFAVADLTEAVEATAAATAVEIGEGGLFVTLFADNTFYSLYVELPSVGVLYEDVITNMSIDLDNMIIYGGPSEMFQIEVVLGLGEDNLDGSWSLKSESMVTIQGLPATFIDGVAYEIDAYAPSALVDLVVEWGGETYQFHLTMSAAKAEATVVVVENANVKINKVLLFGDTYDYSLEMTGNWVNAEDGLTYPVLVEIPVYYPEATEPNTVLSTVTVGGWGDNDPWLGFGEGELTVTTVGNVVTATGIAENPATGIAIDITISGAIIGTDLDNIQVQVKTVKMIKNGQLIINKDGKEFNVQGAIVK